MARCAGRSASIRRYVSRPVYAARHDHVKQDQISSMRAQIFYRLLAAAHNCNARAKFSELTGGDMQLFRHVIHV